MMILDQTDAPSNTHVVKIMPPSLLALNPQKSSSRVPHGPNQLTSKSNPY